MAQQATAHYTVISDEELFARFKQGEEDAFVTLVRRYKNRLTNFVYRHLGELDEAADIVQETFVRVYSQRSTYNPDARFSTWLYQIALNLATSELRRQTRRRRFLKNGLLGSFALTSRDADALDPANPPDSLANSVMTFQLVQKALMKIPAAMREVIILREIENMTYEEIVEITGLELGTVKSRINRGRSKLQHLLRDIYHEYHEDGQKAGI